MNIYKISQSDNNGYDTFDSAVVYALTEEDARNIVPLWDGEQGTWGEGFDMWASSPSSVEVEYLGKDLGTVKPGVILASFNAG